MTLKTFILDFRLVFVPRPYQAKIPLRTISITEGHSKLSKNSISVIPTPDSYLSMNKRFLHKPWYIPCTYVHTSYRIIFVVSIILLCLYLELESRWSVIDTPEPFDSKFKSYLLLLNIILNLFSTSTNDLYIRLMRVKRRTSRLEHERWNVKYLW